MQNTGENELHICKSAKSAQAFISSDDYKAFLKEHLSIKTKIALVHTRFSTVGTIHKNENNHPLSVGVSAVVHNGSVSNHFDLFSKLGLERKADTDSDILRAIVDKEGLTPKGVRELCKVSGSVAAAIVDKRLPGYVMLLRSANPLYYGNSPRYFMFASTKKTVNVASKKWTLLNGVWGCIPDYEMSFGCFPADTAWLCGPGKKEWHQEFKTAPYTYDPYRGKYGTNYSNDHLSRKERKRIKALEERRGTTNTGFKTEYICPNKKCGERLHVPEKFKNTPKADLHCDKCNTGLKDAVEVIVSA